MNIDCFIKPDCVNLFSIFGKNCAKSWLKQRNETKKEEKFGQTKLQC